MRDLLSHDYALQIIGERLQNGHVYYYDADYHYVTMSVDNKKAIYMDQIALAHYLVHNGFYQTTTPIPNKQGDWFTDHNGQRVLVLQILQSQTASIQAHGKMLAQFHQTNRAYPYEPKHVSSYGLWYNLWIDKLTALEQFLQTDAPTGGHPIYQLLRDILPYIIGVSEQAIQLIREANRERFDDSDSGTITFLRYKDQIVEPTIFLNDLAYDHLTRDLAAYIRQRFLDEEHEANTDVKQFLDDYESIQPLSDYSWHALYARLVYPIHFFDLVPVNFKTEELDACYQKIQTRIEQQPLYEKQVESLAHVMPR